MVALVYAFAGLKMLEFPVWGDFACLKMLDSRCFAGKAMLESRYVCACNSQFFCALRCRLFFPGFSLSLFLSFFLSLLLFSLSFSLSFSSLFLFLFLFLLTCGGVGGVGVGGGVLAREAVVAACAALSPPPLPQSPPPPSRRRSFSLSFLLLGGGLAAKPVSATGA